MGFAMTGDGKFVVGGTGVVKESESNKILGGGDVLLWNARNGKLIRTLGNHGASVSWVGCSSDNQIAISFNESPGSFRVFSLPDGELKNQFSIDENEFEKILFHPQATF